MINLASLDDLQELDNTQIFKRYIKNFILQNSDLQKLIYYPVKNPLLKDDLENPYDLFESTTAISSEGSGVHGVVLFRRKCDEIINTEIPIILITFESAPKGNSLTYRDIFIIVRIIAKGSNIQELENGLNRIDCIAKLFDDEFNQANITGLGKTKKEKYADLSINEQNDGKMLIYCASDFSYDYINNKNIQRQIRGEY